MVLVSHWGSVGSSRFWASVGFHSPRNYIRPSPILLCFHFFNFFLSTHYPAPCVMGCACEEWYTTSLNWALFAVRFCFCFFLCSPEKSHQREGMQAYTFHHSPISETFLLMFCFHAHAARYSNLCVEYGGILCQLSLHEHVGCG